VVARSRHQSGADLQDEAFYSSTSPTRECGIVTYLPITVLEYSGSRANERPRSFLFEGESLTIVEILDRWIEENYIDKTRKRFFIVKTHNGRHYKIFCDEKTSEWRCTKECV